MKQLDSFTLHPSNSNATDAEDKSQNALSLLIPGTVMSDFPARRAADGDGTTTTQTAAGIIRASPFEPLVHDRNLPKSGRISPLNEAEYKAWKVERAGGGTSSNADAENASKTDDGNLEVLSKSCLPDDSHLVSADTHHSMWKLRYLQSEMARTETRTALMRQMEEQRQLRIRLIEAEAELHMERNKESLHNLWAFIGSVSMKESEAAAAAVANDGDEEEGIACSTDSPLTNEPSASVATARDSFASFDSLGIGNQTSSYEPVYVNATRGSRLMTTSSVDSDSLTTSSFQLDSTRSDNTASAFLEPLEQNESTKSAEATDKTLVLTETDSTADVPVPAAAEKDDADVDIAAPEACADLSPPSELSKQNDATKRESKASPNKESLDKEPEETSLAERLSTRNSGRNNHANKPPRVEKRVTRSRAKEFQEESPTHGDSEPPFVDNNEAAILATPPATKPRRRISMGGMTFTPLGAANTDENAKNIASPETNPKRDPNKRKRRKTLRNSYQPPVLRKRTRNKP